MLLQAEHIHDLVAKKERLKALTTFPKSSILEI